MKWYEQNAKEHDVVISSRIRLARNLDDFAFTSKLDNETSKSVVKKVSEAIISGLDEKLEKIDINSIGDDKNLLTEDHIISPDFCSATTLERVLLLNKSGNLAIMINEEDHVRIQSIYPGFDLDSAFETANKADEALEKGVSVAFDENLGYLTACPTNLGTGLRASVMMHLPAMCAFGYIKNLSSLMAKIGLTVRGIYGEGSEGTACMYQLSNQVTLGSSEKDTVEKLKNAVNQIITKERTLREKLIKKDDYNLSDKLWRSFGTLKYARKLDSQEASHLISNVRLGVVCGIISECKQVNLTKLLFEIMPYHINSRFSAKDSSERDTYRANYIREQLNC